MKPSKNPGEAKTFGLKNARLSGTGKFVVEVSEGGAVSDFGSE